MISKSSRKKISTYGAIIYIFSRIGDASITLYYSPDMLLEGNPLFYAASWQRVLLVVLITIIAVCYYCYKIATVDYNKPLQGEWFLKTILRLDCNTPMKRYIFELSILFALIGGSVIAILSWVLTESLYFASVDYLLGLNVANIPLALPFAFFVPWIISYNILGRYFAKKYTQSH